MAPSIASRWSPRESIVPPRSGEPSPRTAKPSSVSSMSAPSPRRPSTTRAMRSDSLKRSSPAPRTTVSPSAKAPSSATSVSSSIASGTSSRLDDGALERGSSHVQLADRLRRSDSVPGSSRSPTITAPMRSAMRKKPVRVQLRPTSLTTTREPGTSVAAATMNAADEGSPGTVISSSSSSSTCATRSRAQPVALERDARPAQHALGVVAARARPRRRSSSPRRASRRSARTT